MIQVGIHDNVRHNKATRNDKGTLVLGFTKESTSGLESLDAVGVNTTDTPEQDLLLFPPSNLDREKKVDTAENNMAKLKEFKDTLSHILLNFLPSDKISWNTTEGTGINNENKEAKLKTQETLNKMYENICNQYIKMITPFLSNTSLKFRMLFIRTSDAKHFPRLRSKWLDSNPFMEPMSVPKEQSKLKYTKWEIDHKRNSGDRVSPTTAEAVSAGAIEQADVAFSTTPDEVSAN